MSDPYPEPGDDVPGAPPVLSGAPRIEFAERAAAAVRVRGGGATDGAPVRLSSLNRLGRRTAIASAVGLIVAEFIHQLLHRNQFHHTRLEIHS